jgi:hypothetical protein
MVSRTNLVIYVAGILLLAMAFLLSFVGVYRESTYVCSDEAKIHGNMTLSIPKEIIDMIYEYPTDSYYSLIIKASNDTSYELEYVYINGTVEKAINKITGGIVLNITGLAVIKEFRLNLINGEEILCTVCYFGSRVIVSPFYLLVIPMVAAGVILGVKGMLNILAEKIIEKRHRR